MAQSFFILRVDSASDFKISKDCSLLTFFLAVYILCTGRFKTAQF